MAVSCPVIVRKMSSEELLPLLPSQSGGLSRGELPGHEQFEAMEQAMCALELAKLTPKQRQVVELHFGIGTQRDWTIAEIADDWGVSPGRVFQILEQAQRKLRDVGRTGKLTERVPRRAFGGASHLETEKT